MNWTTYETDGTHTTLDDHVITQKLVFLMKCSFFLRVSVQQIIKKRLQMKTYFKLSSRLFLTRMRIYILINLPELAVLYQIVFLILQLGEVVLIYTKDCWKLLKGNIKSIRQCSNWNIMGRQTLEEFFLPI